MITHNTTSLFFVHIMQANDMIGHAMLQSYLSPYNNQEKSI